MTHCQGLSSEPHAATQRDQVCLTILPNKSAVRVESQHVNTLKAPNLISIRKFWWIAKHQTCNPVFLCERQHCFMCFKISNIQPGDDCPFDAILRNLQFVTHVCSKGPTHSCVHCLMNTHRTQDCKHSSTSQQHSTVSLAKFALIITYATNVY